MLNSNPLFVPKSIRTFTGKYLNVFDPNPDDIDIVDIAHALSMLPRFGGHAPIPYSVAEHSLWVSNELQKAGASISEIYAGLMHDCSEAYLIDIPKPIKLELPDYNRLEDSLMLVLAQKFNFKYPFHESIKKKDHEALVFEWDEIIVNRTKTDYYDQGTAKIKFIEQFLMLNYAATSVENMIV